MLECVRVLNSHFLFSSQVKPYNVAVSVVFPPDTDTPGFENENKNKVLHVFNNYPAKLRGISSDT